MSEHLPRVITRRELRRLVPYTPQHILRLEKKGKFPKRIKIGERRVGWWLHEVMAWLDQKSGANTATRAA
jgi:prophage regulatory protein